MFTNLSLYSVDDLIISIGDVKVILLLESPFSDEVCHKHPLAGSAGRNVSRFFTERITGFTEWDNNTAFGCQVCCRSFTRIAVMNCSTNPLNKSVYSTEDYNKNSKLIDGLDLIRRNPKSKSRRGDNQNIENYIIDLLQKRLEWVSDQLIIPCGDVARGSLNKCKIDKLNIIPDRVPHPSYNRWSVDSNFGNIHNFINEVSHRLSQ